MKKILNSNVGLTVLCSIPLFMLWAMAAFLAMFTDESKYEHIAGNIVWIVFLLILPTVYVLVRFFRKRFSVLKN